MEVFQQIPLELTAPPRTFKIETVNVAAVCVTNAAADKAILVVFGAEIICPLFVLPDP